jgi:hypothetical protein
MADEPIRRRRKNPADATRAELAKTNARVHTLEQQLENMKHAVNTKLADDFNRIEETVQAMVSAILATHGTTVQEAAPALAETLSQEQAPAATAQS